MATKKVPEAHLKCVKMWEIIAEMDTYLLSNDYNCEMEISVSTIKRTAIAEFDDPNKIQSYCYLCNEYDVEDQPCGECPIKMTLKQHGVVVHNQCGKYYDEFRQACIWQDEEKIRNAAKKFLAELKEKLL